MLHSPNRADRLDARASRGACYELRGCRRADWQFGAEFWLKQYDYRGHYFGYRRVRFEQNPLHDLPLQTGQNVDFTRVPRSKFPTHSRSPSLPAMKYEECRREPYIRWPLSI